MQKAEIIRKSLVSGLLVGLTVFVVDGGMEYFLLAQGVSQVGTLLISDAFAGIVAAIFATYGFFLQRQREAEVQQRVDRIVEMNHHVRNALQVITYWSVADREKREMELIREAVDRIEWALREILPSGLGVPTPFRRKPPSSAAPSGPMGRSSSTSA
jgi:hypothetical protein